MRKSRKTKNDANKHKHKHKHSQCKLITTITIMNLTETETQQKQIQKMPWFPISNKNTGTNMFGTCTPTNDWLACNPSNKQKKMYVKRASERKMKKSKRKWVRRHFYFHIQMPSMWTERTKNTHKILPPPSPPLPLCRCCWLFFSLLFRLE